MLPAVDATLEGQGLKLENQNGASYIGSWSNPADSVSFGVRFQKAGKRTVAIQWACPNNATKMTLWRHRLGPLFGTS